MMLCIEVFMVALLSIVAIGHASAGHPWAAAATAFGAGLWFSDIARRFFGWLAAR